MEAAHLDLFTRALMPTPAVAVDQPPKEATFEWVKMPTPGAQHAVAYIDGSRLYAEHNLHDLCARQGWAIAAFDSGGNLVAAANGRTPGWAVGIHATELWSMLMAVQTFDPGCVIKGDCQAVQKGTRRGTSWANAPNRKFARIWGPVAVALEGDEERAVWMPAHCAEAAASQKRLSNGDLLTVADIRGNALVDTLAKQIAKRDQVPKAQRALVCTANERLTGIAVWIGRATAYANNFPNPEEGAKRLRDSGGVRAKPRTGHKRKAEQQVAKAELLPVDAAAGAEQTPDHSRAALAATTAAGDAAWRCTRAKRARLAKRRDAASSDGYLQSWLERRPSTEPPAVSATERMAALRGRLAAKQI